MDLNNPLLLAVSLASAAAYLLAVRRRRFANLCDVERRYAHLLPDDGASMTYPEATEIMKIMTFLDCPFMQRQSLELALFQTYAVPTISSLLAQTRRLVDPKEVGRRADDTGLLLLEMIVFGVDSERGSLSLSRTNYLHSLYGDRISRDDLLYTLCLFIYEPLRLCTLHEWRVPTPLERQARFVFWREVGARMKIADIPKTEEELGKWRDQFVEEKMVYDPVNDKVGRASLDLFLRPYPRFLRPMLAPVLRVLLPEPVRIAFGWSRSPEFLYTLVPMVLRVRALFIKHLFLPRTELADHGLTKPCNTRTNENGEKVYTRDWWFFEPFYVRPTWLASLWRLVGYPLPGDAFRADGYTQESLGPEELRHKGLDKVREEAAMHRRTAQGGLCPFAR